MANIRELFAPPRRGRGPRLPRQWDRYRSRRGAKRRRAGLRAAEVRPALLAAMLLGLVYSQFDTLRPPPGDPFAAYLNKPTPSPWLESERSRAILRAQEGAPRSLLSSDGPRRTPAGGPVRVVDGDTFWINGEKVRIADIDTPELTARCPAEARLAARAARRTRELLASGGFEMHALDDRDRDRYGRRLRVVTRGGRSIGDQLVSEGLARTWTGRREPWC